MGGRGGRDRRLSRVGMGCDGRGGDGKEGRSEGGRHTQADGERLHVVDNVQRREKAPVQHAAKQPGTSAPHTQYEDAQPYNALCTRPAITYAYPGTLSTRNCTHPSVPAFSSAHVGVCAYQIATTYPSRGAYGR
eukprot:1128287-Rhodomonas_salina.1